jgi:hypothetical protein
LRVTSSITAGSHQLIAPRLPFQARSTVTGIMSPRPSSTASS